MKLSSYYRNKIVIYIASRYITYAVQFVTSIVIAAKLGPYYMGIWGFILLILQYFQQIHFGIANSFNVLYVQHRDNEQECNNYIGNSLLLVSYLSFFVIAFYLYYSLFGISILEKYHADIYILWICIIAVLQYFVLFFLNLFRVKNKLNYVAFCQSIVVFLNFFSLFFFSGEKLIAFLVGGNIIGNLLCILLAVTSGFIPSIFKITIKFDYQREILKKGGFLFLYNSCFYFIIISIRTIISRNYSVEEFGLFTFSFSLAHAILLLLEAIAFVVFPKVIGKLSCNDQEKVCMTISSLRTIYITSSHILIYIAMACFPFLILLIPKYENAMLSLNLIALSILMSTCSYGYLEFMISRNKEKNLAILSLFALIINCLVACILVFILRVEFSYVIIATMITYALFSFTAIVLAKLMLGSFSVISLLSEWFPIRLVVPYICAFIVTLYRIESLIFIPFVIALLCNWHELMQVKYIVFKLLNKPETINLI